MAIDKIQSESINLADNFAFTGTVSGAGGANTPAFHVGQANSQSISNDTFTKITLDHTELLDTDNAFSSSRFTPQTAGTYYVYGFVRVHGSDDFDNMNVAIYKNTILNLQSKDVQKTIEGRVLDNLGLKRYCCRRVMLGHIDLIEVI